MQIVGHVLEALHARNRQHGLRQTSGDAELAQGRADTIASSTPFIANPDLVERSRRDAALNTGSLDVLWKARRHTTPPFLTGRGAERSWPMMR